MSRCHGNSGGDVINSGTAHEVGETQSCDAGSEEWGNGNQTLWEVGVV